MKRAIVAVAALAVLLGCSSLPEPEEEGNSLVIGRITLDFPDGFFSLPRRTIRVGIKMVMLNRTRGSEFTLYTSDGYFYFLSNGTDSYILRSYEYELDTGAHHNTVGPVELNRMFDAQPGKVIYLGDLTVTYAQPDEAKISGYTTFWDFDVSAAVDWHLEDMRWFLERKDSNSPWLDYEVAKASIYGL